MHVHLYGIPVNHVPNLHVKLVLSFLCCVCYQEFFKLADRLQLKDVKNDEYFRRLINCCLPILAVVIPSDIMPYLASKNVIRLEIFVAVFCYFYCCYQSLSVV